MLGKIPSHVLSFNGWQLEPHSIEDDTLRCLDLRDEERFFEVKLNGMIIREYHPKTDSFGETFDSDSEYPNGIGEPQAHLQRQAEYQLGGESSGPLQSKVESDVMKIGLGHAWAKAKSGCDFDHSKEEMAVQILKCFESGLAGHQMSAKELQQRIKALGYAGSFDVVALHGNGGWYFKEPTSLAELLNDAI